MDDIYEVFQQDASCWRIEEKTSGGPFRFFMYLFVGTQKAMLVDSGFGTGDLRGVVEGITKLPVMLVNTHADGDHVLGNKHFGLAHMHPGEYDRYHHTVESDAPVAPLWEGDIIDLGGRRFEVVLIPGHTPGSIVLLDRENRVLVGGDSVQDGTIFMAGPGRNITAYIESLRKLRGMIGLFDNVYGGHGSACVPADILDDLEQGAVAVKNGEVKDFEPARMPENSESKVYKYGRMSLLY